MVFVSCGWWWWGGHTSAGRPSDACLYNINERNGGIPSTRVKNVIESDLLPLQSHPIPFHRDVDGDLCVTRLNECGPIEDDDK